VRASYNQAEYLAASDAAAVGALCRSVNKSSSAASNVVWLVPLDGPFGVSEKAQGDDVNEGDEN
jgi:hypothetical protein